jgi:hypothetical protein
MALAGRAEPALRLPVAGLGSGAESEGAAAMPAAASAEFRLRTGRLWALRHCGFNLKFQWHAEDARNVALTVL